jgi:putative SOS response-associated peptidase YedK
MCGRFVATTAPQQLALLFHAELEGVNPDQFPPNYNVAPTTQILHVVDVSLGDPSHDGDQKVRGRVVRSAHWGLLPAWSKDRSRASSMINARSETLTTKPSFRSLLKHHRCVVPVDGYYEWRTIGVDPSIKQPKQPYYIRSADRRPLSLAGLWTTWRDPERGGALITSCCLITTKPNQQLAGIHDRMPCLLDGDGIEQWLSGSEPPLHLLQPAEDDRLVAVTVSTAVNNVRNKGAGLVEPTVTTLF